jgi:glucose/arabinose dehydrogenase
MMFDGRCQSERDKQRAIRSGVRTLLLVLTTANLATSVVVADPPDDLVLQQIATGLVEPVDIQSPRDSTNRVFVVERRGTIRVIQNDVLQAGFFLNIQAAVDDAGSEQGLLGLALHPDFDNNGRLFVNYIRDPGAGADRTVIEEYTAISINGAQFIEGSPTTIIEIEQDSSNHNGGGLAFGLDGHLYIGMGDGGGGNDQPCNAQNMDTLLGKMVRISVDGEGGAPDCGLVGNYDIPNDNPFLDGVGGECDEIWSLGLRNPWRWSFDRFTGDMFIGDVGQVAREEISFQAADSPGGLNFGWKVMEGNICGADFPDNDCPAGTPPCFDPSYTDPVIDYGRNVGSTVSGGYVYRGSIISGIQGNYFYADHGSGRIWIATSDGQGGWSPVEWDDTNFSISAFGEDESGELYLANRSSGIIYRFQSPSSVFGDQFESGDTSNWSAVVP